MSILAQYRERPGYLVVEARGQWTERAARQLLEAIHDEASSRACTRLFLDLRELSAPDTELTRFFSGEHLARVLRPPYRVAAWGRHENINRFAESTAVNRGAVFAVFADEEAALQWLLEEPGNLPGGGP